MDWLTGWFTLRERKNRILSVFNRAVEQLRELVEESYIQEQEIGERVESYEELIRTLEQEQQVIIGERESINQTINKLRGLVG